MKEIVLGIIELLHSSGLNELGIITILLIILSSICFSAWFLLIRPIRHDSSKIITSINDQIEHVQDLSDSIQDLETKITSIISTEKYNHEMHSDQIAAVHNDIDNIKQILAQFQGAMMYNSRLFNNKELR